MYGPLPDELQIGVFAKLAEFKAVLRLSNGALSSSTPDMVQNVRGLALKLFAVPGLKLLPGSDGESLGCVKNFILQTGGGETAKTTVLKKHHPKQASN